MDEGKSALEEYALELSQRLAASKEGYSRLLNLEQDQQLLIRAEDFDGVAAKIAEKQNLLEDIQKIDHALHHSLSSWQQVRDDAPSILREHLQVQVDSLQSVMTDLLNLQKSNEEVIRSHSEAINSRLREIQKGRTAQQGYQRRAAQDAYSQAKFYDKNT